MPHFDYKGVLCGMAAFKEHCTFGFWKGSLIFGEEQAANENAMGHFGRITRLADLPPADVLIGYVRNAVELNEAGVKSPARQKQTKAPLTTPDYFTAAVRGNKRAQKTFDSFSPTQQREYVEWVTGAKRVETREQRLATALEWMAEGKTRHWKYQPKRG